MPPVPELLLNILEELDDKELKTFQWYLYSDVLQGFTHIPKARVGGSDRPGTATLLVQTYDYRGAVAVTVDVLHRMKLKLYAERLKKNYEDVLSSKGDKEAEPNAIQEKLKSTLREKNQSVYEGNADEGDTIYLNTIYTKLHVIEGACGGFSDEHEVRQQRSKQVTAEETSIESCDIFKPLPNQLKRIRAVLTQGIPGVGKTVCAQKFTLSWAEGKENQDIAYIFPLPFRELNPNIGEKDCSLMQLLHQFFPVTKPLEKLGADSRVLFIFDGLDETLLPLGFNHNRVVRDETEAAPLDVLITNLIAGELLGNALVWITTRPAAAGKIPRKHVHRWTEVKGFLNEQKEEYFKRRLRDDALAARVINHVKSSRSLSIMCQIPVFCWITVTVTKKMARDHSTGSLPNSLTEMYLHLLLCQTDKMVQGHYPMESDDAVLKLAELAFRQLEKGTLIFYEADLKECGIGPKEATTYSGVCTELFVMGGRETREVFCFVHLTVQEFLAAVYAHHSYVQKRDNVLLGYMKRMSAKLFPKSVFGFHRSAIEKALECQDGHWDMFLRFLLGLSVKANQDLLARILRWDSADEVDTEKTAEFIKDRIKEEPEAKLNLFHCLSELQDESLVQEIQSFVSSGRLAAKELTPIQWSALTFELMTSEATEAEFDLKKYIRSDEGVAKLLTVIASSTRALLNRCSLSENCCEALASALSSTSNHLMELDLSENNLRDSGVMLLSAGLRSQHCKLTGLRLNKCKLRGDCCSALAAALCAESSQLRELELSANEMQEAGMKSLCQELCSHQNKLATLRLNQCKLMQNCCADLASLLSSGSAPLKTLDLSHNKLKDSGVSLIAAGLRSLGCRLETLKLSWCGLTDKCCEQLGSALGSDLAQLRELDLSGNNLQGPGFHRLSVGLTSPHCKLLTLRLNECHLQKCGEDVASVLSSKSCQLKDINLSGNDLQDTEVKLLSVGLSSLSCKLETLRLSFCSITEEGCTYLASALSSNPHHLRHLDLSYNFLLESGVKLLSGHLDNPTCKLEHLSVDHNAECYLKSKLKNYACRPTLDPNTAGKSLFLHDGGTQVTWVRERQQYPDHPDRFESVSQVLCRQGLTQRHYWEAEWRGRWVDIAVATRGISRRAGYHLCGLGSTERSWSLYCSDGGYSAQHDGEPVEVSAPPSGSRRVGVYLDAPGGTLSFYSVCSGTLSHLHTFHGTFAEPLYPAFGMEVDDCSVTICQVEEIVSADISEKTDSQS